MEKISCARLLHNYRQKLNPNNNLQKKKTIIEIDKNFRKLLKKLCSIFFIFFGYDWIIGPSNECADRKRNYAYLGGVQKWYF